MEAFMLVLHGIYDNGKIEVIEKNPPKIKAKATIQINTVNPAGLEALKKYSGILKNFKKDWE
jgi:hypothetical protein